MMTPTDALASELLQVSSDDPILTQAERLSIENLARVCDIVLQMDDIARMEKKERLARTVA